MPIRARQKLGFWLIGLSVVAFIAFNIFAVAKSHVVGIASGGSGTVQWTAISTKSDISAYYLIPIVLCGAIGVLCLLWPQRKPPKLEHDEFRN